MNIAIVGGGVTGLTAAYELVKRGHRVTRPQRHSQFFSAPYSFLDALNQKCNSKRK